MNKVQFTLHPPAQPSSWAIRVSQGSAKVVQIKSDPEPEILPEHYIFHPKHFYDDDDPSIKHQIIFLKTLHTANLETEQTKFKTVQDEPVVINLEPKNNDQANYEQAKEDGHGLASATFPVESHQSENLEELPTQFELVPDAQNNLQPNKSRNDSKNEAKAKLLTTMIEQILSDSENNSGDMTSDSEDHDIHGKQKQVYKGEMKNSLTDKKSKQPAQRALAEDFFYVNIDEDLSPIPAKKNRNATYSQPTQPKLVHPICAIPGKTWNNHLSSYTVKKLNNLPSSENKQIFKNDKEDSKTVNAATLNVTKQNKTICEMEFLTKKVPKEQPFQNRSCYPGDDQEVADCYLPASTSFDWQLPESVFTRPKQSAPMQGRAVKWINNYFSSGNNQLNNYQQPYNWPSVMLPLHESFSQIRNFNSSIICHDIYNSSFHSTQSSFEPPSLPPPFDFFNDHQINRPTYQQENNFGRNKFKQQKNLSMQQELLPELRICPETFNFSLNGQVQIDNVLCSGILKHFLANLSCFEKEFIVNVVHLGPAYQEDHRNIFLNSAWREFGLNVQSLMKISEVIPKLLYSSSHELVIAILKPDSENFSSHMNCYTALFNHLNERACTGVFSYEHRVDNYRKQKAYLFPLSKDKTLPSELEMYVRDAFPPVDRRPNLLLMIVLVESAKI